jgi:CHAT domain
MDRKVKVLFLASNPFDTTRLKLDEEIRFITMKIRASEYRDSLELISSWAARADDLLQALNMHRPEIVHFSGHGNGQGEIVLTDENSCGKPVSKEALIALFKTLRDNVRIVILNSCNSNVYSQALIEVVDCTIGMQASINDYTSILFAASFYRAIGFGRSVQEAFDQGVTSIMLENTLGHEIPKLYTKEGVRSSSLYIGNKLIEPAQIVLNDKDYDLFSRDSATNLGYGISLEASVQSSSGEFLGGLRVTSSDWGPFNDTGLVRSGWFYHTSYPNPMPSHTFSPTWLMEQNLSHAFAFFKVHIMFNGTGYIHIFCASTKTQSITLRTTKRFEKSEKFSLDESADLPKVADWAFSWDNSMIRR